MGKHNRNRKRLKNRYQKYAEVNHARRVAKRMNDESNKNEQLKFFEEMAELKQTVLARTIVVDNVRVECVSEIKAYFHRNYGPVELCTVAKKKHAKSYRGKRWNESVRVRFVNERHAVLALGLNGASDFLYARNRTRYVKVCMSEEYDDMLRTVVEGTEIRMSANQLALGHYVARSEDRLSDEGEADDESQVAREEWLEETSAVEIVDVKIDLIQRNIQLSIDKNNEINYARIHFKELFGPIELCHGESDDVYSLVVSLKHPPKLYTLVRDDSDDDDSDPTRGLEFGSLYAKDFGRCSALKLNIDRASIFGLLQNKGLTKLRSFGVIRNDFHSIDDVGALVSKYIGRTGAEAQFETLHKIDSTMGLLLRSCMETWKFCWYDALNDFIVKTDTEARYNMFSLIQSICGTDLRSSVVLALGKLAQSTIRTRFPCHTLQNLVELEDKQSTLPRHCVTIPRVLLSPSKQTVLGIEVETSNRVVRQFVEKHRFSSNDFLRVKVGDENGRKLFWDDFTGPVISRIKSSMGQGLTVNGKLYEFLAYSSSQLKDCSLWMVHVGDKSWTVQSMQESMGDFSRCTTPSKVAARMGQCFSATFQGLDGHDTPQQDSSGVRHIVIDDIKAVVDDLVHSDGNGMIRRSKMTSLLKQLPSLRKNQELHHSIVQIRYGGAKGTIVAWEDCDFDAVLRGSGHDSPMKYGVAIRDSMVKFDAPFSQLEVCSIGSASPYYLNRNVIFLLSAHGIDKRVFLDMQTKMLDDLDEMFHDSTRATQMVSQLSGPDHDQRLRLMNMLKCGLEVGSDPFLFSCCLAIRSHQLLGLRKKARIFVSDGAVLMGGIDVLKVLPEYCVYLQVRKPTPGVIEDDDDDEAAEFTTIVGPVMVTKHPVMHPGDVRMLLAVDVPELRGHKNVILFSQLGERPEADKMGGSDLDGDEFAVTWDRRLFLGEWNMCSRGDHGRAVSSRGSVILDPASTAANAQVLQRANKEPLSYTSVSPMQGIFDLQSILESMSLGKMSMNEKLIEHFVKFAINDKLGPLCMLWQDWAGKSGADCNECLLLAKEHSIAVDFAKSGIAANIPKGARWTGQRAHWREKKEESYHCTSVVGELYDQVCPRNSLASFRDFTVALAGRTVDRYGQAGSVAANKTNPNHGLKHVYKPHIPVYLGWSMGENKEIGTHTAKLQEYLWSIAEEQRVSYDGGVMQVMKKYALRNEGELATGCIRKYQSLNKNRQREVAEEVRRIGREIYRDHRANFFRHVLLLSRVSTVSLLDGGTSTPGGSDSSGSIVTDFGRLESMEELDGDGDHDNAMVSTADLDWVKGIAAAAASRSTVPPDRSSKEWMVRALALRLAAAYYLVTYSPWRVVTHEGILLFGFPWIVSDVVASGISVAAAAAAAASVEPS